MSNVKEQMTAIIQSLPEDASYEEIMRELAFERIIERGMEDVRQGQTFSHKEVREQIRSWHK